MAHDHDGHDENDASESELARRVRALESLLTKKGLIDPATLDQIVDTYENRVGPRNGARVVARAWVDPAYRKRLLENPVGAIEELGFPPGPQGAHMTVVENTPKLHNLVVCTLCSCYPWSVLGLPPVWYKSPPYRARAVSDPRGLLMEFGVDVGDREIRVWDSSAEMRYLVLPERPAASARMSEDELAELVTRDSMIGVGMVEAPGKARRRAAK